jgi:hypothetical protein
MKKPYVKPTITTRGLEEFPRDQSRAVLRKAQPTRHIEAGSRFAERRSVPRYPFSARAVILEPLTRVQLPAQVSEISVGGCYLESLYGLPRNTVVQILIHRDDSVFESWGRIVYVHSGVGSGIAFFDIAPSQQKQIERWVTEIASYLDGNNHKEQ